ncbi:hypothetical protein ACFRMQ_03165 [Kitasatospora sp. NPDC056783]|uniref:hypothetical protein n=1 Tax=Kitasatospora sp. NPDC056783 TaxID=3345943 RepID=UPI0036CCC7B5
MDPELTDIATRGATVLAGLMVTSAWDRVKPRVVALFGQKADSVSEELDETRAELTAAPEAGRESALRSVESEWQPRLRRLLAADPALAAELREIIAEFTPAETGQAATVYHNEIRDTTVEGAVFQVGQVGNGGKVVKTETINGDLHF